uniref:Putative plant transposon protein domain-containing protein n=1 Tax=Cannabis sativa TaxID=3483 RepID=A0A803QNR7_CANSA
MLEEEGELDYVDMGKTLGFPEFMFHEYNEKPYQLYRCELNPMAEVWLYFVSARLIPNKQFFDAQLDRLKYVYAIMKGFILNVGDIIRHSFNLMIEGACGGGLGLADIVTDMCEAYGVPQYSYDTKIPPQRMTDVGTVFRIKAPHPHGQPPLPPQQGVTRPPPQNEDENVEQLPQRIAGPLDPATQ